MLGPSQSLSLAVFHISVSMYRELFFSFRLLFFKVRGSKTGKAILAPIRVPDFSSHWIPWGKKGWCDYASLLSKTFFF